MASAMIDWSVVLDSQLASELEAGPRARRLEAVAIVRLLRTGGPDMLGADLMGLEGVPPWADLGGSVSLRLPNPMDASRAIQIEVWPEHKIVLCAVE